MEDSKLRLYVGRVPRDEYLKLRADGWVSTPKQNCDFVAPWTPSRRDTALDYAGVIDDEDQAPEERAADRAERFGDYRDKRTSEATGHADSYDTGPQVHGFQSQARADRSARRHDRVADRAGDAWSKAEYWQRRTAGVISHALYKSTPGVRMGRIKTLEAELRKYAAAQEQYAHHWNAWQKIAAMDPEKQTAAALHYCGHSGYHDYAPYVHPRTGEESTSLYCWLSRNENEHNTPERQPITGAEAVALFFAHHSEPSGDGEWVTHYRLRLAYENQMLEAQGGRAAFVEMQVGGWIGSRQIRKVNKSAATGRVVSVNVLDPRGWSGFTKESGYKEHVTRAAVVTLNIERLQVDAYRAPTAEDVAKLAEALKAEKAKAPKSATPCPLINPTDTDAERLQALWNERAKETHCAAYLKEYGKAYAPDFEPATVTRITQATYSANSKGSYARAETKGLGALGTLEPRQQFYDYEKQKQAAIERGPNLCKLRVGPGGGKQFTPASVVILTDKPQKPFPTAVWEKYAPAPVAEETVNA